MLNEPTRTAILKLSEEGHATRAIARALKVSRGTIKKVLTAGGAPPPRIQRPEKADAHLDRIRELHESCGGNLVRVHEELAKAEIAFSYQALTGFCRRHGIGRKPQKVAGEYTFGPGEEMQHDTSPHDVMLGGRKRRVQTASAVLCYSRMIFMQMYPRFTRFYCKLFLTEALKYFGGACSRCMIDNTHVVTLRGTGREMVPVPEMEVFAERYGFTFIAHEKGDADRKGRVERP
ncbi:MAG: helix-turn-helix domain-containing protein, partial [Candidatus Hydrogenedentota bacterium]